ncbi:FAD-dependent oxidoreductase [Saccharothrix hoggarensis]|uniref:FAD-dependent oxidoreductase n=1 Tax=Saccharothrix hoggarensis TaxID=913853 RepID=A0ABW3QPJ6_9PSEU
MRVAVVGGGVAGALLAWRLRRERADVVVFAGEPVPSDASAASGGLVRGFETDPAAAADAAASLAELRADDDLLEWTGYREIGSVHLSSGVDPTASLAVVDAALPGSATVVTGAELARRFGFRDVADDTVGVVERHAGHLSPARLREHALKWSAGNGVEVRHERVAEVSAGPSVRPANGSAEGFDAVVVAAGAWTPRLVEHGGTLRTKQIQYGLHRLELPCRSGFVDDVTGLYGRPHGDGLALLGLGCERWDVDPAQVTPDDDLAARVADVARRRFGLAAEPVAPERVVASFDCYRTPAGLRLDHVGDGVFTFTGGSGGAAKTVLAASRRAARELVGA